MLGSQAKVESLQAELNTVLQSKALLEKELQEVISLTSAELEEYQEKVLELEDEVSRATCSSGSLSSSDGVSLTLLFSTYSCRSRAALRSESAAWKRLTRSSRWSWSMRKAS